MPLWTIYHNPSAFNAEQKQGIVDEITKIYTDFSLPAFYVGVVFLPVPEENFFVGAKKVNNFVRIFVDHIARKLTPELMAKWLVMVDKGLEPYIKDRGFNWEYHIDETPMEMWSINGIPPPPAGSEAEKRWVRENKPTPY